MGADEASGIENSAMELDRTGETAVAIETYRRAAGKLREAADVCPEGHPDGQLLRQHADELKRRAEYLEFLDSTETVVPLEEDIHVVQLSLGQAAHLPDAVDAVPWSPWDTTSKAAKVRGAAAAISGATGLLVLGPITGVAVGMATAVAATREDQVGSVARKVGDAGIQLFDEARRLNKEHKISHRIESTTAQARQKLVQLDERHGVLDKLGRGLSTIASLASKART